MKAKHFLWILLPVFVVIIVGVLSNLFENRTTPDDKTEEPPQKRKLIISGEIWAPFEYPNENNQPEGIDIEVFKRIFPKLGIDYEVRFYPWSRTILMAKEGEVDFVVSVSYCKSRESYLLYTEDQKEFGASGKWPENYLWKSEYVFFCKKLYADKIRFESYEQIKGDGYKVGTVRDYSYNPEFIKAELSSFVASDINTGFQLLEDGKYDLFPADKTVGLATIKQLGLTDSITYLKRPLFTKPYLMPACKTSDWPNKMKLMKLFFAELEKLRKNGEYRKIRDKYLIE